MGVAGWMGLEPRDVSVSLDGLFIAFIDVAVHGISLISRSSTTVAWDAATVQTLISSTTPGYVNGMLQSAKLSSPSYLSVSPDRLSIVVSDPGNDAVRLIHRQSENEEWTEGLVWTLAGGPGLSQASADGSQATAVLNQTRGLAVSSRFEV